MMISHAMSCFCLPCCAFCACVCCFCFCSCFSSSVIGKVEGDESKKLWHGHVTAVTVAPESRRLGLATELMKQLEAVTECHKGFFVDLFVRKSNYNALGMYNKLGYKEYRTVLQYYNDDEDGLDLRKSMSRDPDKESMKPLGHPVRPEDLEWW